VSRFPVVLSDDSARLRAKSWVDRAPLGWTVEFREAKRTDDQNAALWGLLGQIQKQRPVHNGVQMTTETWKALFLHALGHEMAFVPTLDGTSMLPLGLRSSRLTKAEFSDLLEFILAWAAREELTIEHFGSPPAANDHSAEQGRAA
jgi:hypothetical protein